MCGGKASVLVAGGRARVSQQVFERSPGFEVGTALMAFREWLGSPWAPDDVLTPRAAKKSVVRLAKADY